MPPLKNEAGKIYNSWTVLSYAGSSDFGFRSLWLCRCKCGVEKTVAANNLRRGSSRSCGQCESPRSMKRARIEVKVGDKFGLWEVTNTVVPLDKNRCRRVLARCKCGIERAVNISGLVSGRSSSHSYACGRSFSHVYTRPAEPTYTRRMKIIEQKDLAPYVPGTEYQGFPPRRPGCELPLPKAKKIEHTAAFGNWGRNSPGPKPGGDGSHHVGVRDYEEYSIGDPGD